MKVNKKIVLSGYYGFDNLGDEAILNYLVSFLRENNLEPIVLSHNPEKTFETYGVKAIHRMNFSAVSEAISKSDGLISGGGSLLQDKTSKKSLLYYLFVMELANSYKKPIYFYGQGIGPIKSNMLLWLTKAVLKKTTLLSVRDEESKEFLLSQVKMKNKEINLIHDPVLFNEKITEVPDETSFSQDEMNFLKKKPVFISIRPTENDKNVLSAFEEYLVFLKSKDIPVCSFSYHKHQDTEITKQLLSKYENSLFIERELSLEEASYLLSNTRLVVGLRLHSLIMAASQQVPFLGVSYDPKIDSLLSQFGYEAVGDVSNLTGEALIRKSSELVTNTLNERKKINQVLSLMKLKNDAFNQKIVQNIIKGE